MDGIAGERAALEENVDAIVLDLMLPGRSGMDILAKLHAVKPQLPVIILTARGEVEDRVAGLDSGAVDYLVKPFSLSELAARVGAQLRTAALGNPTRLEAEDVEIDLLSRKVRRQGRRVAPSPPGFGLPPPLMQNHGRVAPREETLGAVGGYQHAPATNIVDVYIGYLRRKMRLPDSPAPIQTVRSVGYRFGRAGA